jgi:hypothetical protein
MIELILIPAISFCVAILVCAVIARFLFGEQLTRDEWRRLWGGGWLWSRILKPYESTARPGSPRRSPPWAAWFLLPVPFGICAGVQYSSLLITHIGIFHLLMILPVPFACGMTSAKILSMYLVRSNWHHVLVVAYGIGMVFLCANILATLPIPFP